MITFNNNSQHYFSVQLVDDRLTKDRIANLLFNKVYMQTTRYNMFNLIHKGLRVMCYHTATKLQQANFADKEATSEVILQLETLLDFFISHADHEDHFILPAITAFAPELAESFENEHVKDEEIGQQVAEAIALWKGSKSPFEQIEAGKEICYAFYDFIAFNLYHMNKEERLLNKVLWDNYSDQELLLIQQKLMTSIPAENILKQGRWMARGINNQEAIAWATGVKKTAPPLAQEQFFKVLKEELPTERYSSIENYLENLQLA